ncbi:tRNA (5-methylaminomethyl-2-thiouridine)(34)-methyltransferase MnmD [Flavobacterium sp. SUN052]|uniref:tRNA (5-methylaminomethyl-2-thiouridine)(34)-methyltransferase MnmD n=1 Tax=Flavobacterium sp. SUN052 TaxID=3002441 RepID=UPI00237EC737|nr:tRNA (5-methylaminomethyl-2-thiouridine)(34)-methyltransferase MnmD [Flavobacterium sp. SUN052]MEC4003694.1 tRNA (5-methylaminomethyl-2-thiouridine)(34)-methyltransferase MnmD [Flavobacterium sp. SUN052]
MKREILTTQDGSTTIHLPDWDESYHSKHGAIQEAYHVFIKSGFSLFNSKSISILEIGFGTGLNAFITYLEAEKASLAIDYVGVEAYPVQLEEALQMNYVSELNASNEKAIFSKMHEGSWNEKHTISNTFSLTKRQQFFQDINDIEQFDLIYFDAFGFRVQPELWSLEIFQKMFTSLKSGGVLVTYACRTSIKNAMKDSGFSVEKLPGAPGKREMLRGIKK